MTPVRGTVRLVADLSLVGEDELVLLGMALVTLPALWLGLVIAGWLVR